MWISPVGTLSMSAGGVNERPRRASGAQQGAGAGRGSRGRVILAPDKFKGTFSAGELCALLAPGFERLGFRAERLPVADGGEGTAAALVGVRGGHRRTARVPDALGRPVTAEFFLLGDGSTAVVEVAAASGLWRIAEHRRDALRASSRGTGELIAAAIAAGAETVIVAAGGSATTDGGSGALEALLPWPGTASLIVACDVSTPWERAAEVFAPQKGAGSGRGTGARRAPRGARAPARPARPPGRADDGLRGRPGGRPVGLVRRGAPARSRARPGRDRLSRSACPGRRSWLQARGGSTARRSPARRPRLWPRAAARRGSRARRSWAPTDSTRGNGRRSDWWRSSRRATGRRSRRRPERSLRAGRSGDPGPGAR